MAFSFTHKVSFISNSPDTQIQHISASVCRSFTDQRWFTLQKLSKNNDNKPHFLKLLWFSISYINTRFQCLSALNTHAFAIKCNLPVKYNNNFIASNWFVGGMTQFPHMKISSWTNTHVQHIAGNTKSLHRINTHTSWKQKAHLITHTHTHRVHKAI